MIAQILVFAAAVYGAEPSDHLDDQRGDPPTNWSMLYDRTAREYEIFRESAQANKLRLAGEPIYKWNAASVGGVSGNVYLWTHLGCAEAVGCFWGNSRPNGRSTVAHELHSLSPVVLVPVRPGPNEWRPAGTLERHLLQNAPAPASKAPARLVQMRSLAREFTGHTIAPDGERRQLRLLTAPFYRYQSSRADVLDGALFAFVCTVGTDPEVFLLVEDMRITDGPRWHYALARFGSRDLFMKFRENEVWQSIRGEEDTIYHNADNTYWLFHEPVGAEAVSR